MKKSELKELIKEVINEIDPNIARQAAWDAAQKDGNNIRQTRLNIAADKGDLRKVERSLESYRTRYNEKHKTAEKPEPLGKDFADPKIKIEMETIEHSSTSLNPRINKKLDATIHRINPEAKIIGIDIHNEGEVGVSLSKKRMVTIGGRDGQHDEIAFDRNSALKIIALFREMGENINGNNIRVF